MEIEAHHERSYKIQNDKHFLINAQQKRTVGRDGGEERVIEVTRKGRGLEEPLPRLYEIVHQRPMLRREPLCAFLDNYINSRHY